MQILESEEQERKASVQIRWSREPDWKVTIERFAQSKKQPSPRTSTEGGMQMIESDEQ
jgi:hypothetical protein